MLLEVFKPIHNEQVRLRYGKVCGSRSVTITISTTHTKQRNKKTHVKPFRRIHQVHHVSGNRNIHCRFTQFQTCLHFSVNAFFSVVFNNYFIIYSVYFTDSGINVLTVCFFFLINSLSLIGFHCHFKIQSLRAQNPISELIRRNTGANSQNRTSRKYN